MVVLHVSQADTNGGAARAAYRLHRALLDHAIESRMKVRDKKSDDWTVVGPESKFGKASSLLRPALGGLAMRLQKSANVNYHTGNWLPSAWSGELNKADAEVVHLHWVAGETLSIEDIGRISKPVVWTLHDMWPFCGTEHVTIDDVAARWRSGYGSANRPACDGGFDLDRIVWQRKRRAWKRPMHIIAPSQWMGDCARQSALFSDWRVSVIPNVLDTNIYQPLNRKLCRQTLSLPADRQIILFGAMGGGSDPNKGYDLLLESLRRLESQVDAENVLCVVFGQSAPRSAPTLAFPIRWMGYVHDDTTLALLYNAADLMVVPSRQEAFGQTASEAQGCGIPVVAFNNSGLLDVVAHRDTGYLARAFDTEDMARGMHWILSDARRREALGRNARARALRLWASSVVVPQYLSIYRSLIELSE